jgi:hypothetical protein
MYSKRRVQMSNKNKKKSAVFWDITPCSPLNIKRCFGGTCRLRFQGRIRQAEISMEQADYSSTLKIEACSSERSFYIEQTTQRYILQDRNFHNHRCENLKSYRNKVSCQDDRKWRCAFTLQP